MRVRYRVTATRVIVGRQCSDMSLHEMWDWLDAEERRWEVTDWAIDHGRGGIHLTTYPTRGFAQCDVHLVVETQAGEHLPDLLPDYRVTRYGDRIYYNEEDER